MSVTSALGPNQGANFAMSGMGKAIQALYGIAGDLNDFFDRHIAAMRESDNPMIERTGRVLEAAKFGFGLGYMSSVIVVAIGQLLLGNQLAAMGTLATAAVLANPIAMTCAAVGAIYYGWSALSDSEQREILRKVCDGLNVGAELIKAVIGFVFQSAKDLMGNSVLKDLAASVSGAAAQFGRTLAEIAHKTKGIVTSGTRGEASAGVGKTVQGEESPESRQQVALLRQLIESDRLKGGDAAS